MKSEIRSQSTGCLTAKSEVNPQDALRQNQKPEIRNQNLPSVLCRLSSVVCLLVMLLGGAGCEQISGLTGPATKTDNDVNKLSVYSLYAPVKINIIPLTEFISADNIRGANIHLYVSLLDSFGSQIKSPCKFRFELYQRVQRSAEPKGRRVVIWPDIDLTDLAANHGYWRDHLRAYEFNVPFGSATSQSYILQVTCLCSNGRHLSTEFAFKLTN